MGVQRVQKAGPGYAISTACALETRRIGRPGIATDDVVSRAARVIRIVDTVLGVVEDIEELSPKFQTAGFGRFEMPQQCHIEVDAAWVVEKVSSSIAEGEPTRCDKLRWVAE
jgi:hypothetical protein